MKSQQIITAFTSKPSYFQRHINQSAKVIFSKCQNDFMEMKMESSDEEIKKNY